MMLSTNFAAATALALLATFSSIASAAPGLPVVELPGEFDLQCQSAHPKLFAAINAFCSKDDIVVPSTYAAEGTYHGSAHFRIRSLCPGQEEVWVPEYWCKKQAFQVCAHANPFTGAGQGIFGAKKCQNFQTNPGPTD